MPCKIFDSITRSLTNIKEIVISSSIKLDRTSVLSIGKEKLKFSLTFPDLRIEMVFFMMLLRISGMWKTNMLRNGHMLSVVQEWLLCDS